MNSRLRMRHHHRWSLLFSVSLLAVVGGIERTWSQDLADPPQKLDLPAKAEIPSSMDTGESYQVLEPIPASEATSKEEEAAPSLPTDEAPVTQQVTVEEEPRYRSIALIAERSEITSPVTNNVWVMDRVELTEPPPRIVAPAAVLQEPGMEYATFESYSDADSCGLWWSEPLDYTPLPQHLLWQPPLANQREPRMFGKFTNLNDESTIETAIGAQFGLIRFAPPSRPFEGIQWDAFAAVFTRFNNNRLLVTSDFRAGVPLTYAKGPWQAKISYEHTSTHLGDEFIHATGAVQVPHVRDEIVIGLAYSWWETLRAYGQAGYSFITSDIVGEDRDRYNFGIEYMSQCPTDWRGRPFAALDFDLRSDQDFNTNVTVQVGWHWRTLNRRSGRLMLEYYNGKSPYGQFFQDDEDWIGFGGAYDW